MVIIENESKFGIANRFEVTYNFPKDYEVWPIGKNFNQLDYIPLCKVLRDFQIDITSLKALYVGEEAANIIKYEASKKPFRYKDFVKLILDNPNLIKHDIITKKDEDYVSFYNAQLANKLKFNYKCDRFYFIKDDGVFKKGDSIDLETHKLLFNNTDNVIPAPELYYLHKWIRINYNLFVNVHYVADDGIYYCDVIDDLNVFSYDHEEILKHNFYTYEEVLDAGIKFCLNLINTI